MSMDHDKLREAAMAVTDIPAEYVLVMEDSIPKDDARERGYIWEHPGRPDERIEIALDLDTAALLDLRIESANQSASTRRCQLEDVKAVSDAFLAKHMLEPSRLTWVHVEEGQSNTYMTFKEEVGGVALPDTGCELTLDAELNVVRYRNCYAIGARSSPEWPKKIADAGEIKSQLIRELRMELAIVAMHPGMHEGYAADETYRLVYVPHTEGQQLDAVTGRFLYEPEHDSMPPSFPILTREGSMQPPLRYAEEDKASIESKLGMDSERNRLDRSHDDGGIITLIYRAKDEQQPDTEAEALSVDGYLERIWGEQLRNMTATYRLQFEKATGRLIDFSSYRRSIGEVQTGETMPLSRSECWRRAKRFMELVFPEYDRYLHLQEAERSENAVEPAEREFFYLPVYIGGCPVHLERVTICVSTATGEVMLFSGVSIDLLRKLERCEFRPSLAAEEAAKRYLAYYRLRLRWHLNQEQPPPVYRLIYETVAAEDELPFEGSHNRTLRYIDALNGDLIWDKVIKRK
ncbi:hypothetical protein J2T15_001273 [Paenibacillus harenae]|uniref:YcdB/YcdC repeated domain-containing protein n=2 Tax=Paenibacillus harenae TaxID=306543 RepID=A0ABT9TWU3_PAEHA|nr:hypothetical protein [Paenibacillus harenae]